MAIIKKGIIKEKMKKKEEKEAKVEEEKDHKKWLLLLLLLLLFLFLILGVTSFITKGTVYKMINRPSAPKIAGGSEEWAEKRTIEVVKDAKAKKGLDYYEYCVQKEKSLKNCEWKITRTKNTVITETGIYYVTFRGVDKEGTIGKNSNTEVVYIDNNNPVIKKVQIYEKANQVEIQVEAEDYESGIEKYEYSIDGERYEEGEKNYTIKELKAESTYTIYIKITDKVGNKTIYSKQIETIEETKCEINCDTNKDGICDLNCDTDGDGKCDTKCDTDGDGVCDTNCEDKDDDKKCTLNCDTNKDGICDLNCDTDGDGKCDTKCDTDGDGVCDTNCENKDDDKKCTLNCDTNKDGICDLNCDTDGDGKCDTKCDTNGDGICDTNCEEEKEDQEIPILNLDKVPSEFPIKSNYDLPSYYKFGPSGGEVVCTVEKKEYKNTNELSIGTHLIQCIAKGNNGINIEVTKQVKVKLREGETEEFDGWIRLNLYYPENSTNWEWRIGKEDEIRTGYEFDGWQEYTGPILIKLSDVENVYIRYDINGETVIIPPVGKVVVDIEPEKYTVTKEEETEVKITYDKQAATKEYRVGSGDWQEYKGSFKVGKNTIIEARAIKEEKVYDSNGEYVYTKKITGTDSVFISEKLNNSPHPGEGSGTTPGGTGGETPYEPKPLPGGEVITKPIEGSKPSTYLKGPNITSEPKEELTEQTSVRITTEEEAEKIYYKENDGNWKEYTGSFELDKNEIIASYYIRKSDGKQSDISYYYVQNIKQGNKPYVRIDATPNTYLSGNVKQVEANISGRDYDTLEYSFDGVIYERYTSPIQIETSTTIYARGTNAYGTTIEKLKITTESAPIEKEKLEVSIFTTPASAEGLISKTKISISYDARATKKYYRIGNNDWQEYTGEFEVKENTTIYAYAQSEEGVGRATKGIDFLTTGIMNPIITVNPTTASNMVKVTIEFDKNANRKYYKINGGPELYYTGPFEIYGNSEIYAYNNNILGYEGESTYQIENIIPVPKYSVIDYGEYYIIKLNYPNGATGKEYKWQEAGKWKPYDEKGILLIKNEYKDKLQESDKGIKVKDQSGKEILFTDNYYVIEGNIKELMESLFMRWNPFTPSAPVINVSTEEGAKEVEVFINYEQILTQRYYKLAYADGTDTGWLEYNGSFKIDQENTVVYAKGMTRGFYESEIGTKKITNIDHENPIINIIGDFKTPKRQVLVSINATDNFGIESVKWARKEQSIEYFQTEGSRIGNNGSFSVSENGTYTIYAKDKAGNESIEVIEITNIDQEAPNIRINLLTEEYGTEIEISIDYGDSKTKEYKIGEEGNYQTYTNNLHIKANDVLNLGNEDGSLTIYARGTDAAGNERIVSERINALDLDAPKEPQIIQESGGYPILTEYGVKFGSNAYIIFDERDDIDNYYSTDGGATWNLYNGPFEPAGTIMAKSVKKRSGLTITSTKKIVVPSDALGSQAYDGDTNNYISSPSAVSTLYQKLYIDEALWGFSFDMVSEVTTNTITANGSMNIKCYNEQNQMLSNITYSTPAIKTTEVAIPNGTKYVIFELITGSSSYGKLYSRLYEIFPHAKAHLKEQKHYPTLTEYGVEQGYNEITVSYFPTSVQRLYSLNNGETWEEYQDKPIRVVAQGTLLVKGIDEFGKESEVVKYTATLPSDALGTIAYDGNTKNYISSPSTVSTLKQKIYIDETLWGHSFDMVSEVTKVLTGNGNMSVKCYNEQNQVLSTVNFSTPAITTTEIAIPNKTQYVIFELITGSSSYGNRYSRLYEIFPHDKAHLKEKKYYPTLTESGVKRGYSEITIEYFPTSVQRLYSLNNGETWEEYQDKPVEVSTQETILVKGIDKFGKESGIVTLKPTLPSDALGTIAYDGNTKNYISSPTNIGTLNQKLYVDEALWGHSFDIVSEVTKTLTANGNMRVRCYNEQNQVLSTLNFSTAAITTTEIAIPNGTKYVLFELMTGWSSYGNHYSRLYEVTPSPKPSIRQTNSYSHLTSDGMKNSSIKANISFFSYLPQKLYSLDNGKTWNEYTQPFEVKAGTVIKAKGVLASGSNTKIASYTVTAISDVLPSQAYDGNKETYASIATKTSKAFTISEDLINRSIRFFLSSTPASDAYIKVYDKANSEIESITLTSQVSVLNVPENGYKVVIYSGSSVLNITEVSLRDELKIEKEKNPIIEISDTEWNTNKGIEITYPEGDYQKEYSIDNGTTWVEYTESINIKENGNIFARVVENGKVIGSSSFTITKIDTEAPTIELDIPDSILEGTEYTIPTNYTTGISGGTPICKIEDTEYTTTKDLKTGAYTIECSLINGTGKEVKVTKEINIIKQLLGDSILRNNTIVTTLPTLTTTSEAVKENGLYSSTNTNSGNPTYYFRGNVNNNYVSFAGFLWRIVRINEDGTIRMITQDYIGETTSAFNTIGNEEQYMYYSNSDTMQTALNNWYQENLVNYDNDIIEESYCEQAKVTAEAPYANGSKADIIMHTTYEPQFKCNNDNNGKGILNTKIGLLTYDENVFAGGYYGKANASYYLYFNTGVWWLMSPCGYDGNLACSWYVAKDGNPTLTNHVFDPYYIRPVINLKADITCTGNGTIDNPYEIQASR